MAASRFCSDSTAASTSLASISISSACALAAAIPRSSCRTPSIVPPAAVPSADDFSTLLVLVMVIAFLKVKKHRWRGRQTASAVTTPSKNQKRFLRRLRRPPWLAGAGHGQRLPAASVEPGIVMGVPVDSERGHVDGVIAAARPRSRRPRRVSRGGIVQGSLEVEPTTSDEPDGLSEGSGHGSKKSFVIVKGHLQTPSPDGEKREKPATSVVAGGRTSSGSTTCRPGYR